MKIVAFGHRRRVGKNTAAMMLEKEFHNDRNRKIAGTYVKLASFATKLKDISYQLYSWAGLMPEEFYEDFPEKKEEVLPLLGMTPREIWIKLGTPAIREQVYDDTWVDCTLRGPQNCDILIITDLRFPNEVKKVQDLGGYCIKINRPEIPKATDVADCALESCMDWDYVIENDRGIEELQTSVHVIAQELRGLWYV